MSNNVSSIPNQMPTAQSTVVAIGSQQNVNLYVRPKRAQPIFQPASHQHLPNNNLNSSNLPPRMRMQNNQRSNPPPGNVNLERSYQICQAVIQNSTNRLQLNNHNKPPSSHSLNSQKFQ
jgi:hypothetical protein